MPITRRVKRVAPDQPNQVLLYYPDGSYKKPENNPLGSARAGQGVVKCEVESDDNGRTRMRHLYNISLPVITEKSLGVFQHLYIGANEHSNIVGEWSALACTLKGIVWTAENSPNGKFEIEIRQDCFEVIDVLMNKRHYTTNVLLINEVRKLWRPVE